MKKSLLIAIVFALTTSFLGSASPAPGCADLTSPGTWTNLFRVDGDSYFMMSDALTYRITAMSMNQAQPDSTGQWDSIQQYSGVYLSLTNAPGTPWHSSSDTNLSFEIDLPALWIKTRSRGESPTNPNPAYVEMEVSAHGGRFICLAYLPGDPGFPTNARPRVTIRSLPTDPPQIALFWNCSSTGLYQFQFRPDLGSGDWADLGTPIMGTGASRSAVDTSPSETAQRFYRILEFP